MVSRRSKRTKKSRKSRKSSRSKTLRRVKRGGSNTSLYKFNQEILDNFLSQVNDDLPARIGGFEGDNTGLEEDNTVISLGGRGASGVMDSCKFRINTETKAITFEVSGDPENEELGNAWTEKSDNYTSMLNTLVANYYGEA